MTDKVVAGLYNNHLPGGTLQITQDTTNNIKVRLTRSIYILTTPMAQVMLGLATVR
jgi:hypothetical protein